MIILKLILSLILKVVSYTTFFFIILVLFLIFHLTVEFQPKYDFITKYPFIRILRPHFVNIYKVLDIVRTKLVIPYTRRTYDERRYFVITGFRFYIILFLLIAFYLLLLLNEDKELKLKVQKIRINKK